MNEERMNEMARQLGARAAERLDVGGTARKVVERLREQPVRRTIWVQPAWLRIAAALVVLVGGSFVVSRLRPGHSPGVGHGAHFVADDLHDLSADQLRDVLATFDDLVTGGGVVGPEGSTDLRELDAPQLRAVLRSLEG
jgi:hypothetical protein